MIAHPEFSKMTLKTPESRIKYNETWAELSTILNSNGPPARGIEGWKRVWSDYKCHIRNKIRKNNIFYSEPRGDLQKRPYALSPLEHKIASFFEYISQDTEDVSSTLSFNKDETKIPSTINSSTSDETMQLADQSDVHHQQHNRSSEESIIISNRYSPPLSRKCKKELLQAQIENQKDYAKHSKKILLEINDNLKGILKYSIKNFELKQKKFELEKEKFMFKKKIEARKYQTELEKLQLQRDILRLKQETIGLLN